MPRTDTIKTQPRRRPTGLGTASRKRTASRRRPPERPAKQPEHEPSASSIEIPQEELIRRIEGYYRNRDRIRRGVCLLNAGHHNQAAQMFREAHDDGAVEESLPACLVGAHQTIRGQTDAPGPAMPHAGEADSRVPEDLTVQARVRRALTQWSDGQQDSALATLRDGLAEQPDCAEYQFQLGTLLAAAEQYDEARLRFAQVLAIDKDHTDAMVQLGLCDAAVGDQASSLKYLQRAQRRRPWDARLALLFAEAVRACTRAGKTPRLQAMMPPADRPGDAARIDQLVRIAEEDPDFVGALLAVPADKVDPTFHRLLLETLRKAIEHQPEQAELHHHCGRVLERLGQIDGAIEAGERAVGIDPRSAQALIMLARLYTHTERTDDAVARLEQVVAGGFEYPDVYYMLGNLYRRQGQIERAGEAYRHALTLNGDYGEARAALDAIAG